MKQIMIFATQKAVLQLGRLVGEKSMEEKEKQTRTNPRRLTLHECVDILSVAASQNSRKCYVTRVDDAYTRGEYTTYMAKPNVT